MNGEAGGINGCATEKNEYYNETRGNPSQEPHNLIFHDPFFDFETVLPIYVSLWGMYTAMALRFGWEYGKLAFGLSAFVCGFMWGILAMVIWEFVSSSRK